jgi:hypothetical protein
MYFGMSNAGSSDGYLLPGKPDPAKPGGSKPGRQGILVRMIGMANGESHSMMQQAQQPTGELLSHRLVVVCIVIGSQPELYNRKKSMCPYPYPELA